MHVKTLSFGVKSLSGRVVMAATLTFLPSYLDEQKQLPSKFVRHPHWIGCAGYPGLLGYRGYDQTRLLGPISTQQCGHSNLPIELIDIGFGVAEGQSPLSFASKSGYLN